MADPWWRTTPLDLQRVSDRISSLYVERCHIDRDENAVVVVNRRRAVRVPAAMLATLLLGPGTRATHAAITLLADSGTAVCWVGERGVRFYAASVGTARGSATLQKQAWLVTRATERLRVARSMYQMRFPGEDVSELTMRQLRGREGARIRAVYREHSKRTGVAWTRREYKPGEAFAAGDDVNRLLSAGNACLYGLCHAAIVGIGASPGLGFVHVGSAVSFVLDVADLYKTESSIPLAFDLAASGAVDERDMRLAIRDYVRSSKLLARAVADIQALLDVDPKAAGADLNELWDDGDATVPGGANWSPASPAYAEIVDDDDAVSPYGLAEEIS
ncbi:MAG: type I-E CRISPR-associated endonuclease Cas1e [Bifidobacteriaceae bacterium]|jgi:CRISPR-associated protein Cas1|nr:type I-E CRISPR-associated endonuclease Cas1e [Bifidobacteriaceae bacterium]